MSHISSTVRHRSDDLPSRNYYGPSVAPYEVDTAWHEAGPLGNESNYNDQRAKYRVSMDNDRLFNSSTSGESGLYARNAFVHRGPEDRDLYNTLDRSYNSRLNSIRLSRGVSSPPSSPDFYHRYNDSGGESQYHSLRKNEPLKPGTFEGRKDVNVDTRVDNCSSPYSTIPRKSGLDHLPHTSSHLYHPYSSSSRLPTLNDSTSDADSTRNDNDTGTAPGCQRTVRPGGNALHANINKMTPKTPCSAQVNANRTVSKPRSGLLGFADRLTGSVECSGEEVRSLTNSRWCSLFILTLIVLVIFFVIVAASILFYNCKYTLKTQL